MTPKTLLAAWPSWAGRAALAWSLLYATGAAVAAVTGPAFGYALLAKATGTGAEAAAAALYGTAALLAYALLRRPDLRRLSSVAWAVVALCLTSGFAALLSPVHLLFFLSRNQPPIDWAALANQALAVLGAVLWGCAALAHRRHALATCPHCGRTPHPTTTPPARNPALGAGVGAEGGAGAGAELRTVTEPLAVTRTGPGTVTGPGTGTTPAAHPGRAATPRADGPSDHAPEPGLARRAGLVAVAALVPYAALKTAWALGLTAGFTGTGRPGVDPRYTSDLGIRLYDHGVDITAVLALLGMALALALTRAWGRRLPRLPLLALGWAGAGALAPFGVFLAAVGVLTWTGTISVGLGDHAPWVFVVAYGGFCGYGLALARATRAYQRATRRACEWCRDGVPASGRGSAQVVSGK
ncbi:hypothetical protein ACFVZH_19350 [Streptomyces sp. NPDC059534]|uniref:hypothetical protein n=1 Tax=Streptomyces sp. NPDC059534 TaxID=3346859 RepID=UPI0036AB262F